MMKNSSSTSGNPNTAPALRNSRSSFSATLRLVSDLVRIGEQRQLPFSRTTATAKPSGVSGASFAGPRCGPMAAYGSPRPRRALRICQPGTVDKAPVCVVGLGLIGGSVLRAAAGTGREAFGYNRSVEAVQAARFDGFDVTPRLDEALNLAAERNALIVLAVPAPALPILLPYLRDMAPGNPITDVISVKTAVLEEIQKVGLEANFVGGHPMAGSTDSGWSAGDAGLFVGAPWVVAVDDHVDPHCFTTATELALDCGAIVVPARSDDHDAAAAAISNLPHLVAEAVAITAGEVPLAFALAAGSFRDVTRVAATTPELVRAFCEANADQLLPVLDRTIELLTRASTALAQNGSVADLVDGGHAARTRYDSFSRYEITGVVVGDEGWRQTLAAAGRAGGVIRSVPPVRDSPG